MANTSSDSPVFKWAATIAVGIIVALASSWANHVDNALQKIFRRLVRIEVRLGE